MSVFGRGEIRKREGREKLDREKQLLLFGVEERLKRETKYGGTHTCFISL